MSPDRNICLIISPSIFLLDERVFVSLGILRIAAVLENQGYDVEVVDLSGIENYQEAMRAHVRSSSAKIFGLTSTTPQLPAAVEVSQSIRSVNPDAKVILGGPHITLVNAACKREQTLGIAGRAGQAMRRLEDCFDVLVAGDGEEAIFEAINPDSTLKLIDADDPKSSMFLTNNSLENLPFPSRHLLDLDSYHYTIDGVRATSLIAQLGCPFECGFCGGRISPMLRRIRTRSSENIVAELIHLHKTYGMQGFMFYDDELNVNKNMVELMQLIAKTQRDLGVTFSLRGFIKAELFTDEQAEAMYEAGFRWILTGFETGSPRILRTINKKATQEDNTRCIEIARRHNLKVKGLMSMGHPGETEDTIQESYRWLKEVRPNDFDVTIITCYPGTPYYDYAVPHETLPDVWIYTYQKTGDRLYQFEVDYTKIANYYKGDPDGGYQAYVYTDSLSREELVERRDWLERTLRQDLNIPFNPGMPTLRYEHSMGQLGGPLPSFILRKSKDHRPSASSSVTR
ncbi:MAG: radical SAM protein [Candidatus Latescibacteria bacterium]|nr:radical SAM protein [Candidatus Latescibacterota bacterium]